MQTRNPEYTQDQLTELRAIAVKQDIPLEGGPEEQVDQLIKLARVGEIALIDD